jgi:transposase
MISPEIQAQILTLYYSDKRSMESISRELGINRKTVIRVVERREVRLVPNHRNRTSGLDPYKETIRGQLRKDSKITGSSLLNQLRMLGYTGGITVLRDFVLQERGRMVHPREAFLRLEFGPGEVAQVDWGEFGDVFGDGVKIHCFAMVMAYSRMIYIEFTRSEKFEEFIRCHEAAFRFFGGAPKECWYDNLASAVSDRINGLIRFNVRFMAYMAHHAVRPHACNVAKGNEKGRVENLIKYIRMNFWSGRQFTDFEDLTRQMIVWRNQTANAREHRTTRRVVKLFFESEEKPKLLSLNPTPYDTDEIFSRNVTSDFHLQYESNRYSVPWTLVGMTITVRVNHQNVKVYYNEKFICSHPRSYLKNQVFTTEAHRAGLLERKPGATSRENWQLGYVKSLGPKMKEYIELVRQGPRSLKYELGRLVALVTIYGEAVVLDACSECLSSGIVGVDNIELYLKRKYHPSRVELQPEPITFDSEKLNRVHPAVDLRKYDALLFEVDHPRSASEEVKNGNDNDRATPEGRPIGTEAQILGTGDAPRSAADAGSGERNHLEISHAVDRQGKSGEALADDSKPGEIGEVPKASDGGEF